MHLKNFAVLHQDNGIYLSPAFDLLNVGLVNPDDEEELALTLNAKKKGLRLKDFIIFGTGMQIPEKAIENSCRKFISRNKEVDLLIKSSFLSQEMKELYMKIWMEKQELFTPDLKYRP